MRKNSSQNLSSIMKNVESQYKKCTGKFLDWDNLTTYNEKMQWEKVFDKNPLKVQLSDKLKVRAWVEDRIGIHYLIPLLGKWDSPYDIDFDSLPENFVLKTNCGSGDVIIVRNKSSYTKHDFRIIKEKLNCSLCCDFGMKSYELHYRDIEPCIIAEAFIESGESDLPDYKFMCFDGKPYYCWVDKGRYTNHSRHVYDMNWNFQNWNQFYPIVDLNIPKPQNWDEMVEIATKLCKDFSHVRVDLYNIEGTIYFGEMTFTNGSGYELIYPEWANLNLGNLWKIDCGLRC